MRNFTRGRGTFFRERVRGLGVEWLRLHQGQERGCGWQSQGTGARPWPDPRKRVGWRICAPGCHPVAGPTGAAGRRVACRRSSMTERARWRSRGSGPGTACHSPEGRAAQGAFALLTCGAPAILTAVGLRSCVRLWDRDPRLLGARSAWPSDLRRTKSNPLDGSSDARSARRSDLRMTGSGRHRCSCTWHSSDRRRTASRSRSPGRPGP